MKSNYKPIGNFIRLVDVRNKELKNLELVGVTVNKRFIPSVANIIGSDMTNYKIIKKNQFACSLMQVRRDGKIPVALFEDDEAIISQAYPVFEIVDKNEKIRGQSLVTVASMGIGITIGNLLGGVILDSKGVPAMLIVSTVFSFLGFVIVFLSIGRKNKNNI